MCPQIACLRGYIVTLVAVIWLFSNVRFQMQLPVEQAIWFITAVAAFVNFARIKIHFINLVYLLLMPPSNWPRIVKTKKMLQLLQMLFSIFFLSGHYNCHGLVFQISKMSTVSQGFKSIVSSNTRSYSDSVLLGIRHQLFEILSISAKIFSFFNLWDPWYLWDPW